MEILIALTITAMILVPLLAWATLAIKQQPVIQDDLIRTNYTSLLASYFPRDVAAAGAASTVGEDCIGGDGAGGSVRLVLLTGGGADTKVVYSEAPGTATAPDGSRLLSVWRRVCDPDTGAIRDAVEAFEGVVTNSTLVTCSSEAGDSECRQIDLTTTPVRSSTANADPDGTVHLRATRRVDYAPPTDTPPAKIPPTAVITVVNRSGTQPLTVDFSADDSIDLDGTIVNYRWEFAVDPTEDSAVTVREGSDQSHQQWVFPVEGDYTVWLTVTDDDGLTHTTHRRISTDNHAPVALIDLGITRGTAGADEFTFSSVRSYDPDGSVASHEWRVDFEADDLHPDGVSIAMSGSSVGKVFPSDVYGTAVVTLTVTDLQGESASATTLINVYPPATDPTDPDPTAGTPIPVISVNTGDNPRELYFDGSGSTDDGQIVSYLWQFATGLTSQGPTASHLYPAPGEYEVRLTVVDDTGHSATATKAISIPGAPTRPGNPWRVGNDLVWNAVPGVKRYLVDFEFYTNTDCDRQLLDQAVGAVPNPRKSIPANPCPKGAVTRARVGAEANGQVVYSDWVVVTSASAGPPNTIPGTTVPPQVVK